MGNDLALLITCPTGSTPNRQTWETLTQKGYLRVGMIIVFCLNISERDGLYGIDHFNPFASDTSRHEAILQTSRIQEP